MQEEDNEQEPFDFSMPGDPEAETRRDFGCLPVSRINKPKPEWHSSDEALEWEPVNNAPEHDYGAVDCKNIKEAKAKTHYPKGITALNSFDTQMNAVGNIMHLTMFPNPLALALYVDEISKFFL
jgi:hypothetical protein